MSGMDHAVRFNNMKNQNAYMLDTIICLVMAMLIICCYWQVQKYEFINYDDYTFIVENSHVRNGLTKEGIKWAFSTTEGANWHPLTWLSLMMDAQLYRGNPGGYHWTNVLFHIANTVLLFLFLRLNTGHIWKSAFVASLFALHPLHVESVAWISERKDVLGAFFWMITLLFYARYVKRRTVMGYISFFVFFILGLMSKPMVMTLPFVLLLLDEWPLKHLRFKEMQINNKKFFGGDDHFYLREKIPLIICSIVCGLVALYTQKKGGALLPFDYLHLDSRLANAVMSYVYYLYKMIWPCSLALFYPHPGLWPFGMVLMSGFTLLAITIGTWVSKRSYLKAGWLWYMGTLIPVIGLIQVGKQAMADRYTYLPLIGIFIMIAWGVPDLCKRTFIKKYILPAAATIVIIIMAVLNWHQIGYWKNSVTLFQHTLSVTRDNYEIHNNLGVVYFDQQQYEKALSHYKRALQIKPGYAIVYNNVGKVLLATGDIDGAIEQFSIALQKNATLTYAKRNLADALINKGEYARAVYYYKELLIGHPDDPELHNNLGVALAYMGEKGEALAHFKTALQIKPDYHEARANMNNVAQWKK